MIVIADDPATDESHRLLGQAGDRELTGPDAVARAGVYATIGLANQVASLRDAITLLTGETLGDVVAEAIRLGLDGSDLSAGFDLIVATVDAVVPRPSLLTRLRWRLGRPHPAFREDTPA